MKNIFILIASLLFTSNLIGQVIQPLGDINPGSNGSAAFNDNSTIFFNDILFFSADDGVHGDELWIYQNSEIQMLKDINEGAEGSEIQSMFIVGGKLIFIAETETSGREWWTSDGTAQGTQLLVDINTGSDNGVFDGDPSAFIIYNNELYFTGILADNFNGDFELWKTDGTASGTQLVRNISNFTDSFPDDYAILDGVLYFSCWEGFWKTDGTEAGTQLIKDEDPDDNFGFEPSNLIAYNGMLLMLQSRGLWRSDGTEAGTERIFDVEGTFTLNWSGPRFRLVNGFALFPSNDNITGPELWRTDGTTDGTQLVKDVWPGADGYAPQNTVVFQDKLFYKGDDGDSDIELFVSDGTESGTQLFYEFSEFSSGFQLPSEIIADDNIIYARAGRSFQSELWIIDGISENTYKIDINPDGESSPGSFYLFDDKLFCFANRENSGREPFIIDIQSTIIDNDNDGFASEEDCDDNNPDINPDAEDIPNNGIDEDCDGLDFVSSTYEIGNATIKLFPNPVVDVVQINITGQLQFVATLYDLDGKMLNSFINPTSIDMHAFPKGTYLLHVKDLSSGKMIVEQLIKG